ncbi:hypothetical protein HOP50_04g32870 [Chloropicon primus]|uniref:Uncharacterized protein n=1 Tax=Chloropicon primus TaxID=1764295 RepID=A0A5B8MM84_9CHLO|nr:hypothetical protein A3770_04p32830 [Chloropicon primus]UPQ99977.1 hypothetical protein HOP50_04g32870 [Chloropicon primus]|eukprot:QDZ20765.1 hypothetical protein A3770_04p32830 [Chloropicon primus]
MATFVRVVRKFLGDIQHVKVRDLPSHVHKEYIGPSNTWGPRMKNRLLEYKEDYIDEGSFVPVKQVMVGVFFMSYLVGLPAELRHLRHEEEMKRQGGHH